MSVDFIGMISARHRSEIHPPQGPAIDRDYVRRFARAHEEADFDRILIPYGSTDADTLLTASYAAAHTDRIGFMLAHRPGFVAPTLAARKFATLDQFTGGRIAVHVVSGGSDAEQQRDGDFLTHDERYARTDEYLAILKRVWTSDTPFDHEGRYYRFRGAFSEVKPAQKPHIPIYFGGSSDAAIEVAGRHAEVYALWGETLEQVRETIAKVRSAAVQAGRDPNDIRYSLSLRPVLAETEEAAWARAERILTAVKTLRRPGTEPAKPQSVGSQRLLAAAANGRVVDKRLWTEVAAAIGAGANTTSLVGTPEQVAESLLDYYDAGVTTFLIRGFDPFDDAVDYGLTLLPLVRQAVAQRSAPASTVAAAGGGRR
jgi:alkanesulfonate monooxygenase